MIESKPDWVMSRQRAWGSPITIFVDKASGRILKDERVNEAIVSAFETEGADAWFADDAAERFLKPFGYDPAAVEQVRMVLDVWFDSGSTHAYTLEVRRISGASQGRWRARHHHVFGGFGPAPRLVSVLAARELWHTRPCALRCGPHPRLRPRRQGREDVEVERQRHRATAGDRGECADILRLWVAASDYSDDLRIGAEILKTFVETYRKLRHTMRWMLGSLHHFREEDRIRSADMPELERFILHRLAELDGELRQAYAAFDYKRAVALLASFMTSDLSAFYFDIRKDALYCDPISSTRRKAALTVIDETFRCVALWIAPILPFTAEEAWLLRYPSENGSVHLETFPDLPAVWRDRVLAERWAKMRRVRRVVTGALEIERAHKRIGSSLEAAPAVYISDDDLFTAVDGLDFADICLTSDIKLIRGAGPSDAFRLDDVPGVGVVPATAQGTKCARSWRISPLVGSDPAYPDVTPRDAAALREWDALRAR